MFRRAAIVSFWCMLLAGCGASEGPTEAGPHLRPELLAVQQAKAYPETVTGMFVSLADFEDSPPSRKGYEQVGLFSIAGGDGSGHLSFVVNVTRTGAGAMEVVLPAGAELTMETGDIRDFSDYRLVSMAVHSPALRDDLTVTIRSRQGAWVSHRTLIRPGWNTVLFDIQRLGSRGELDVTDIVAMSLSFADSTGPVRLNIDDVMLVDNERLIEPAPQGISIRKNGLDYHIHLPHRPEPVALTQRDDGLWRLGYGAATIQVAAAGEALPAAGEHLAAMGDRKVGLMEMLEHNAVRVRLANTWYFPRRSGEWLSLAVRSIRWEYTIYADGRWVTHVELNNAGGNKIALVRMWLTEEAAWSAGVVSSDFVVLDFAGPVGRWSFLLAPKSLRTEVLYDNHIVPGLIQPAIAAKEVYSPGDVDRDRFDQSAGCYFLASVDGQCRFTIIPPPAGLLDAAFQVAGPWRHPVSVNAQGLAVRKVVELTDGSALFMIPGWLRHPTAVEVSNGAPSDAH